jgi:hypothetical protein
MNKESLFFTELDDERIELLIKQSSYNDKSLDNIKSRVERKISSKGKRVPKRIFIIAAAIVLFSTGVLAAAENLDTLYRMLFYEHTAYMQNHGQNVDIAAEIDGIEVKMLSTFKYAGSLTMVVSIRDTEGNRIDESTAFDALVDFGGEGKHRLKGAEVLQSAFDGETGEFVRVETVMLPMDFEIGDITYTVANLRSSRVDRGGSERQIDLYGSVLNRTTSTVPESPECPKHLTPEETHIPFSDVDWSYVSNMGFVDGVFHIQIKDDPFIINFERRKRGWLFPIYLIDSGGMKYEYDRTYHFPIPQLWDKDTVAYTEYVFDSITDIAQLPGMILVKGGYEYMETFDAGWFFDDYTETVDVGGPLDAGWFFKFKVPPGEVESLTIPVKKEIPVVKGVELYADYIVVTPLYMNVTYLIEDLENGLLFRSLGITEGMATFDLRADPDNANFITYDDGTIFKFEFQYEEPSFWKYSATSGMYEANVRYSKLILLSEGVFDIIEVNRIKSVTVQGMEFKVESLSG